MSTKELAEGLRTHPWGPLPGAKAPVPPPNYRGGTSAWPAVDVAWMDLRVGWRESAHSTGFVVDGWGLLTPGPFSPLAREKGENCSLDESPIARMPASCADVLVQSAEADFVP